MKNFILLSFLLILTACGGDQKTPSNESPQTVKTPSSVNGKLPTLSTTSVDYKTIKEFTITGSGYREYDGKPSAWVMFSKPLPSSIDVNKFISLSVEHLKMDNAWQVDESGINAYYLNIKPKRNYQISVKKWLRSADDTRLSGKTESEFNSPNIQTTASFLQQGVVLNPNFSEGLPILAVNLPWVDVSYYRIKPEKYDSTLSNKNVRNVSSWSADYVVKNATLLTTQKYNIDGEENQKVQRVLKTSHLDELKKPGVYVAIMSYPQRRESVELSYFTVSQLGHEIREYKTYYLITVSEQNSGSGVKDVEINTYDYEHKRPLYTEKTDEFGQVRVPKNNKMSLLTLQLDNDFTVVKMSQNQPLNLADFSVNGRKDKPLDLFVFGARDLYRRGEAFTYYAILRDNDGKRTSNISLKAQLRDPKGNIVKSAVLQSQEGLYQFDYQLKEGSLTGHYNIDFTLAKRHFNHQFSVEDFMPERLELKIDSSVIAAPKSNNSKQPVTGLFLYGAPAVKHKVDGVLQLTTDKNLVKNLPNFYFGNHQKNMGMISRYDVNEIQLDKQGKGNLSLKNRWSKYTQALALNGYAYLYEKSGRRVTKQFKQVWWPTKEMLGIKPLFDDLTSDSNAQIGFELVRSNFQGELFEDNVTISLIRHQKDYYWEHSSQGGWKRSFHNRAYPVYQSTENLTAKKTLTINAPVEWGEYELVVQSIKDKKIARIFFNAGEEWYWRWSDNNNSAVRPDQIDITLDKASYSDGDIANVKIDSPYTGKAWLRIESDDLLWQKQVEFIKGINELTVPIKDWQRHDVYLSAYLISPMTDKKPIERALGLTHIKLNRDDRALSISIDVPTKIKPNITQKVSVNVSNGTENTRVVLAAVDVGILNLHNFKTPDPLSYFFEKRSYDVAIRDNFNKIIKPNDFDKANILWGGGAEMARGGQQASSYVQIVSSLSAPTYIDPVTKEASFNIDIPYFNGRLRVFAIAFDDEKFASEMVPLTVADDVVSQINMPRFLAVGDSSNIKLDLTNTTNAEKILSVTFDALDLGVMKKEQSITLAPKETHTFTLVAKPKKVTQNATINVSITGDDYQNERQWKLAVRYPYPAQRRSQSQTIKPEASLAFAPKTQDWHKNLQSSVSISTRPQFDLTDQINKLYEFPLGCLEQTSSRLYPWLILPPETQEKLKKELGNIDRTKLLENGISRILSMQTYNGGLSLWSSQGREAPWLSAYGAQVLLQAQTAGMYVPKEPLEKLLKRLSYYLRRDNFSNYGYSTRTSDKNDYRFSTKAYSSLVLASTSNVNQNHMRQLANKVSQSKSPLAVVQLAAAFTLVGDERRAEKLIQQAKSKRFSKSYNGNYSSEIRDTALMISLLLEHKLDEAWAQKLAFSLWKKKQQRDWFSTQERLALVLADNQLEANFGDDFDYKLSVGDTNFTGPDNNHAFYRIDGQAIHQSTLVNTSENLLFVDQISQGYSLKPPTRQANSISVERVYYDMSGNRVRSMNLTSGKQYIAHIKVSSEKKSYRDIMVVDLLPAGLEIANPNFGTTNQSQGIEIAGKSIRSRIDRNKIDYQGYLDDRYIASISVNSYRDTELFYQVQAVTPGVYKQPQVMAESMYINNVNAVGTPSKQDINIQ